MKFDKRYWIFIAAAMVFAAIASACTVYLSLVFHAMECNSVASVIFSRIGMIPAMLLGVLGLLPLMIAIPYALRQNERLGLLSVICLGAIVSYTAFDAVNDVSAVMGFQHAYLLAHSVLDTTNNVSGTILGTGPSLC
jgi:hypothetical protein